MKIILVSLSMLIGSAHSLLPFLFELPINDQPDCVDYSSDCLKKIDLCKNKAFEEIMRTRCPRTCRICGEIVKDLDDYEPIDKPIIQRHKSLSPSMVEKWSKFLALNVDNDFDEMNHHGAMMNVDANADLDNDEYATDSEELFLSESTEHHQASTIMPPSAILQPPPSYPLPPSVTEHHSSAPSAFRRRKTCQDHAPNCFYLRKLCHNSFYQPIMKKNCEKTCQFCVHKKHGKTKWTNIGKRPPHSWMTNGNIPNEQCRNRGLDCDDKIQLCTHWRYYAFMRKICALSCGFCDVNNTDY